MKEWFEKEDFFDLVITFDIFFDKKEIRLVYKTFFYWKKTDTYYSNINLSCEYLEFIKKSIKSLLNCKLVVPLFFLSIINH